MTTKEMYTSTGMPFYTQEDGHGEYEIKLATGGDHLVFISDTDISDMQAAINELYYEKTD